ncbi:MAG: S41 family peptidase [Muribaculaceae bacterium]|nr:S41 family peptidase [Muribaculaceae bacterium]
MRIILAIIAAGILATIGATGQQMLPNQKLRMAEAAVSQFYVDTVDEDKLVETAIRSMLEELDPHSAYSNPQETKELNEPLAGNFSGIGISFNMSKDTLYVISTVAGGPSERVGLLAGDRIIKVNDSIIAGQKMRNTDIMKRLRGPKGTKVKVSVLRRSAGKADTIDFNITRADIPINSVDAAYMVDPKTGYIRLSRFSAETANEIRTALKDLKKKGMKQLILDLVDNGGGYMQPATEILGEFLEPGKLAVYTEGRNSPRYDHITSPDGLAPLFNDGRLVVMVNQYTASSSEITTGAIQDWDRGVVVGRRTYGKGLVQRPFPFADGSMMRLTVAHYYTPTGRDIQKPYNKGDQKAYAMDMMDRFNHGELMHEDSIKHIDSLRVETFRLHRPIYGGGGITPDKFVPLDTTDYTKYYRDVTAKGVINQYAINYVDTHRKEIKKQYKNDDDFVKGFVVTPDMLNEIYERAKTEGVDFNEEQARQSEPLFKMILKGLIGRDVYDQPTYFKVYNEYDPIFKEAYRIINSPDYDRILSPNN